MYAYYVQDLAGTSPAATAVPLLLDHRGSAARQYRMVVLERKPDITLVYGDANSTVADVSPKPGMLYAACSRKRLGLTDIDPRSVGRCAGVNRN